jgi:hypothetical protein
MNSRVEQRLSDPARRRLSRDPEVTLRVIPQHPRQTPEPVEVRVKGPLLPGPVGAHLAVFDYNRDVDRVAAAAAPRRDGSFPDYGLDDFRFHQLNAYAVASRAVELVELELGRGLGWGFEASRLIVLPHAGYMANAFYSEETHSLQFYSFRQQDGEIYHTALVHDIVAHETGHALLDAVRDRYTEANEPETAALHEAIGDLTAVFAALSHAQVRSDFLRQAGPELRGSNPVASIADDFGGSGPAGRLSLRDLTSSRPPAAYAGVVEPHDLSLKLTTAVWQALVRLFQANRAGGDDPDEALRLARRAVQRMVVRALDYLPPADATFEDFAVAMLRADSFANPDDRRGFRSLVAQALTQGGVLQDPQGAREVLERSAEPAWRDLPPAWPRLTPLEAYVLLDAHRRDLALGRSPGYRDFVVRGFDMTSKPPDHTTIDEVILVYEYPVEVELPRRFGSLAGRWITIWGGGTLVFDSDGGLRHHARKPVTAARIRRTLEFLASIVGTALTEVHRTDDDQLRLAAARRPYLAEVGPEGVAIRTNPAARCGARPPAPEEYL